MSGLDHYVRTKDVAGITDDPIKRLYDFIDQMSRQQVEPSFVQVAQQARADFAAIVAAGRAQNQVIFTGTSYSDNDLPSPCSGPFDSIYSDKSAPEHT